MSMQQYSLRRAVLAARSVSREELSEPRCKMGTVGCGLAIECPRGTCGYEPPPPKPRDWLVVTSQEKAWMTPRFEKIRRAVCAQFGISKLEIMSHRRGAENSLARARMVCMYLARKLTSYSLPEIGHKAGGFDHTTVLHAVARIAKLRATDPTMDAAITAIERKLESCPDAHP